MFKLFLILVLGFLLRLINLNQSLWLDEAITAVAVKTNSYDQLINIFSRGDFHPPFYYLFLKFWTNIFGIGEIALRAPSIIFCLITVFFIYKISGKKAALFLAISPLAIYYSQEARMYSLAMMFVAGSIWFLQNKKWSWFVLFAAASIYTDYLPILMFPVYFLISQDKKRVFYPIIFFLPWLPSLYTQLINGLSATNSAWGDVLGRATFKNLALIPAKFIFGRISLSIPIYAVFSIVYVVFVKNVKNKTYWLWFLTPLILGFIISLKIPIFTYFRFLFVLPAFTLILAESKFKWVNVVVVFVSLFSLVYFNLNSNFQREDWRSAVEYINRSPGQISMPNFAQGAALIYYNVKISNKETPVYLIRYVQEIFDPTDSQKISLEVNNYKRIEERSFNGVVIWKYSL